MSRPNPLVGALAGALLLSAASRQAPALAQSAPLEGPRRQLRMPQLTPEQQQKLFPGRKALLLQEQKERIAILQRSERCVNRAASADALRGCLLQERRDHQELRSRFRAEMRQLFARNGIAFPQLEPLPPRQGEPGGRGGESI